MMNALNCFEQFLTEHHVAILSAAALIGIIATLIGVVRWIFRLIRERKEKQFRESLTIIYPSSKD